MKDESTLDITQQEVVSTLKELAEFGQAHCTRCKDGVIKPLDIKLHGVETYVCDKCEFVVRFRKK